MTGTTVPTVAAKSDVKEIENNRPKNSTDRRILGLDENFIDGADCMPTIALPQRGAGLFTYFYTRDMSISGITSGDPHGENRA